MADRDRPPRLSDLTDAILDGGPVDWEAAESRANRRNKGIIRQLRHLSSVADAHRSLGTSAFSPTLRDRPMRLPARWGSLELIEHIGRGSFGDVYRAWDARLDRHVALKLLRADADGGDTESAIISEGRLLARVRHPNVVTIHGADRIDGRVGLWMEFVRGHTLERLLGERGAFGPQEALLIGVDLCRALAAVHRAGVVHRDIKTQNVIREDGGRIVLMDFGTGREPAAAEHDAILSGTPLYLAPELFDGRPATQQSDIYSLGVLVFHLVTRSFPILGRTVEDVRRGHLEGRRVWLRDLRPDLSEGFIRAIEPALAQEPGSRYQTAGEMEQKLLRAIAGLDGQSSLRMSSVDNPIAIAAPPAAVPDRRRSFALVAVAAAVAAIAGTAFTFGVLAMFSTGGTPPGQGAGAVGAPGPELAARRLTLPPSTYVGRPSPDGRYLSYVDLNGDLCLHELAGGAARCLTNKGSSAEGAESQIAFSPDGKKLAYTWRALDGVVEIRVVGDDGEWPRVLLRRPDVAFPNPLQWTADGTSVLALLELRSRDQQLVLIGAETGAVTALRTFSGGRLNPAISPDGRVVVFDRPQDDNPRARDIYALSVDTPAQDPYALVQHSANDLFPFWTPDGRLLFVSDRTGSLGLWAVRVTDGARTGDPELVARDLGRLALPLGLTRDGALYYQLQNGMIDVFAQSIDLTGAAPPGSPEPAAPTLVGMNTSSEWSPDGRSLAYVSLRGMVQNDRYSSSLMIRDVGTGRETALAPALMFFLAPRWSPDGRTILVRGTDLEGREGIFAIDAGSGQTTPAVIFPINVVRSAVFQWSPDGRSIWYDKSEARAIVAHALDGGKEDVVIEYGGQSIVRLVQGPGFRVSPDGRSIAYTGFTFEDKKAGTVAYARVLDGPPIELARASSPVRVEVQDWSPDGAAVLLTKGTPADRRVELVEARLDGAPLRTILTNSGMRDVALRRDGRAITYTAGANTLEVWVLENFLLAGASGK